MPVAWVVSILQAREFGWDKAICLPGKRDVSFSSMSILNTISVHEFRQSIGRFLAEEDGPTAVEYAVMLAMIVIACLGAVLLVGQSTSESYTKSANSIDKAMGGGR